MAEFIETPLFALQPRAGCLFAYILPQGRSIALEAPVMEINGRETVLLPEDWRPSGGPLSLPNGCLQQTWQAGLAGLPGYVFALTLRAAPDSPILRFRYSLRAGDGSRLTKRQGRDNLAYWAFQSARPAQGRQVVSVKEIEIARYNRMWHSYMLCENEIADAAFRHRSAVMGPIVCWSDETCAALVAYEHGSQAGDAFLRYHLSLDGRVTLRAVRGNYWHGFDLSTPFESLWFQIGAVPGSEDDLATHYRRFVLERFALQPASRQPYIFYNTWNYQERLRHWRSKTYLDEFDTPRMLAEIDAAHAMGIEVFVLDTGWYEKTGDWQVSPERFPDGLGAIRERLAQHGMRLGLWFNPSMAALTSRMAQTHPDCLRLKYGEPFAPARVWLTEESQPYCIVSRFGADVADRLIELARALGVTYFKWDAVETYAWGGPPATACDAAHHGHGDEENPPEERADCAAFRLPLALTAMAERIVEAIPEAIVDFDITEGMRAVGLAFLSVGRYFLFNNGPYFHEYDMPLPPDENWNMLFYPGPARPWFCRSTLTFDRWLPSALFLTHFFPDDPLESQRLNIGSLILGGNGLWGDLLSVSPEGRAAIHTLLAAYKRVRAAITRSTLRRFGAVATSPEIYEKLHQGRGAVVIFADMGGEVQRITSQPVTSAVTAGEGLTVERLPDGRARLRLRCEGKNACGIAFFE